MSQWEEGVVDPMQPLASVCHKFPRFSLQHLARLTFGTSGTLGLSLFNPVDSGTVSRSILSSDFGNLNRGLRRQIRRVWDLGLQAGCILALPYQVKFRTPLRASLTQSVFGVSPNEFTPITWELQVEIKSQPCKKVYRRSLDWKGSATIFRRRQFRTVKYEVSSDDT